MNKISAEYLIKNLDNIIKDCKVTHETINIDDQLVAMSVEDYNNMLLREAVIQSKIRSTLGEKEYSIEELEKELDSLLI